MKKEILGLWQRLQSVKHFDVTVSSLHGQRRGEGDVSVLRQDESNLIFQETGRWREGGISFWNKLHWSLRRDGTIELAHLRQGVDAPTALVRFVAAGPGLLQGSAPHCCGKDTYSARLRWDEENIYLSWAIVGPKKNERQECRYF